MNTRTPLPAHPADPPTLGATYWGSGRCRFLVGTPHVRRLEVIQTGPVLPDRIESCGEVQLSLAPHSLPVYCSLPEEQSL